MAQVMNHDVATVEATETPVSTPAPPSLKVLLIEDNPLDARLIQIMLAEAGAGLFSVERVDRLAAGLARLAKGDIGMVLLDLSLPDSHGLGTFEKVHADFPNVPIIVMSGLSDETVAVNAVHEGAQDYLVKGQVGGPLLVRAMRYALERVQLAKQLASYAEELRERNAQMEADFAMAREIQQIFLPQQYPTFPRSVSSAQSALRFHHRYLPAAAVGGDFFNVFALTDTTAGVFICDVMGHGMRAALVTAIMRGLVEELIPVAADAGKFLTEINRSLHTILRRTDEPMLSTALYLIVDVAEGEMRYASAGHPSAFRVRRDVGAVDTLKSYDPRHGPAMGLFEDSTYPVCRCPLAANDLLLLFTDGLYEIDGANQEEYGQERLLAAVRQRVTLAPEPLFDEVLADVKGFSGNKEFDDDVCLVGVEVMRVGRSVAAGGVP